MDSKYILIIHYGSYASADPQYKTSAQGYSQNKHPIHLSFSLLCIQQNRYFVWPPLFSRCSLPIADQASGLQVWCLGWHRGGSFDDLSGAFDDLGICCLMSGGDTEAPGGPRSPVWPSLHSTLAPHSQIWICPDLKTPGEGRGLEPHPAPPSPPITQQTRAQAASQAA